MHIFSRQKGTATIEFALTAPLLILLMLAVAELGWALNQYITLVKAVRDGGRYASAHALGGSQGVISLTPEVIAETRQLVVYGHPTGTTPVLPGWQTSMVNVAGAGSGHISVSASYPYTPVVTSVIPPFFGSATTFSFTMQTATVVRAL
jgi:Flp pilus assembly protein TadG